MRRGTRTLTRWWGRRFRPQALILLYHRVTTLENDPWSLAVTPEHFAEHMEVLRRYTYPLPLRDLVQRVRTGRFPEGSVAITFDDGYRDNLYAAKPLLERHEIPATVFIATGYTGREREFWWDELEALLLEPEEVPDEIRLDIRGQEQSWRLASPAKLGLPNGSSARAYRLRAYKSLWGFIRSLHEEERQHALTQLRAEMQAEPSQRATHRLLSAEEIATLVHGSLVEVGAHTVTHSSLAALPLGEQRHEIAQSKRTLEEITQGPVTAFSYPFGKQEDYTPGTVALVRSLGLECACSNIPGPVHAATDPHQLPRLYVHDEDGDRFAERLSEWMTLTPYRTIGA